MTISWLGADSTADPQAAEAPPPPGGSSQTGVFTAWGGGKVLGMGAKGLSEEAG